MSARRTWRAELVAAGLLGLCGFQQADDFALPYPWLEACVRMQDPSCRRPALSPLDLARLNKVINDSIRPRPDPPGEDVWTAFPADRAGDCDDVAMTKRAALQALGFAGAMRMALGMAQQDGRWIDHAVLEVDVGGRTLIMDSLPGPGGASLYAADDPERVWRPWARENPDSLTWTTPAALPEARVIR